MQCIAHSRPEEVWVSAGPLSESKRFHPTVPRAGLFTALDMPSRKLAFGHRNARGHHAPPLRDILRWANRGNSLRSDGTRHLPVRLLPFQEVPVDRTLPDGVQE